jgi:hypothetical protein
MRLTRVLVGYGMCCLVLQESYSRFLVGFVSPALCWILLLVDHMPFDGLLKATAQA